MDRYDTPIDDCYSCSPKKTQRYYKYCSSSDSSDYSSDDCTYICKRSVKQLKKTSKNSTNEVGHFVYQSYWPKMDIVGSDPVKHKEIVKFINDQHDETKDRVVKKLEKLELEKKAPIDEKDDKLCKICLEKYKCITIIDCGHYCLCVSCSEDIMKAKKECPICRAAIVKGLLKTFE